MQRQCYPCPKQTKQKAQPHLEGLCAAVRSHSFSQAGEREQHRSPLCASRHCCWAGEASAAAISSALQTTGRKQPSVQNSDLLKTADTVQGEQGTAENSACRVPSGHESAFPGRLQRCPMEQRRGVQTSFSDGKACASLG